jgi:hypothetical protein
MGGDQLRTNLQYHEDCSMSYSYLAATDYSTASPKIPGKVGFTIFVCRIALAVTTDNAATQQFQDSASTPLVAAGVKASPGIGPIVFDFGDNGFALTEGKSLDHKMSGAGQAGSVAIIAYYKRTTGPNVS